MLRLLTFIAVLTAGQLALANESVPEFHVKASSEKFFFEPWFSCDMYRDIRPSGGDFVTVTDLDEGCGASVEVTEWVSDIRAATQHGRTRVRFNRDRPVQGSGLAASTAFANQGGRLSAEAKIVSIQRPRTTLGLSLRVAAANSENFQLATVNVFDDKTDELLLAWTLGDKPGTQSLELDDHFDRAFRYEYEFDGFLQGKREGYFGAFLNFQVPEPSSSLLALFGILPIAALRKRRRR